jgi:hypothetical protein
VNLPPRPWYSPSAPSFQEFPPEDDQSEDDQSGIDLAPSSSENLPLSQAESVIRSGELSLKDDLPSDSEPTVWPEEETVAIPGIFSPASDPPWIGHHRGSSSDSQPDLEEYATSPREPLPEDELWGSTDLIGSSPNSQLSDEEHSDDSWNKPNSNHGFDWDSYAPVQVRRIDWTLVDELEETAQKSGYIQKGKIYQLCKGLSPLFEDTIYAEQFTENFDNYPNLQGSIASKVLKYIRTKAKLDRLLKKDPSPQNVEQDSVDDLTEEYAQPLTTIPNGTGVERSFDVGSPMADRGHKPDLNPGRPNIPAIQCEVPGDVFGQMLRVDITAEEKIAAFEQALRNKVYDSSEERSRRLELENDPNWLNDIRERQANLEQRIQQRMETSGDGEVKARLFVNYRNQQDLRSKWGDEGVRSPTPSPTRRERTRRDEQSLRLFKAQLTCLTWRRKHEGWLQIPLERRLRTPQPIKPSSDIAWLDALKETTRAKRGQNLYDMNTSVGGRILFQPPVIQRGPDPGHTGEEFDHEGHANLIPPLRLHGRPSQISHTKSGDNRPDDNSSDPASNSTMSTISHVPSDASSNMYLDIHRHLAKRLRRKLQARIGMDAMSEAMELARLNDEDVSTEQLVYIAETAMSETALSKASSEPGSDSSNNPDLASQWSGPGPETGFDRTPAMENMENWLDVTVRIAGPPDSDVVSRGRSPTRKNSMDQIVCTKSGSTPSRGRRPAPGPSGLKNQWSESNWERRPTSDASKDLDDEDEWAVQEEEAGDEEKEECSSSGLKNQWLEGNWKRKPILDACNNLEADDEWVSEEEEAEDEKEGREEYEGNDNENEIF